MRAVLVDYLAMLAESIAEDTRENDYRVRLEWLIGQLGESTPAAAVTFSGLEAIARQARPILMDVTIKRRLRFWRAAMVYAAKRGVVAWEAVPELPPWLKDDRKVHSDFYTPAQFAAFRLALPPGPTRRWADIAFWSGMHSYDIVRMRRQDIEPGFAWEGSAERGRFLRRNHKNRRCEPTWIPCESEFAALADEWLKERGRPDEMLVGRVWNLRRSFQLAASRADLPPVRPNLGLRASYSTMLLSRGHSYEFVRLALGHAGEVRANVGIDGVARASTGRPTTLTRHYLRPNPEILRPQAKRS